MKSKYRNLKFKDQEEFDFWLTSKTDKIIRFKDMGQDLQEIYIDIEGEILHCDMQSFVWCGRFVDLISLKVGAFIYFSTIEMDGYKMMDFLIESIQQSEDVSLPQSLEDNQ